MDVGDISVCCGCMTRLDTIVVVIIDVVAVVFILVTVEGFEFIVAEE